MRDDDYIDESQESFETRVFDAVRSEVNDYCEAVVQRWPRSRIRQRRPPVRVIVRTVRPVMHIHDRVQAQVDQSVATDLPGAVVEPVRYVVEPYAGPPDIDIMISPPAASVCVDTPVGVGDDPPIRLLLAYRGRSWRFPLSSMDTWVGVGRDDGFPAGGSAVIQVPSHVRAVPRARLLLIQYWRGQVRWRRSAVPSRYIIRVDGRVLAIDDEIASRSDGTIDYVGRNGIGTRLTYQLTYDESEP
jgi:hypothetical protein